MPQMSEVEYQRGLRRNSLQTEVLDVVLMQDIQSRHYLHFTKEVKASNMID